MRNRFRTILNHRTLCASINLVVRRPLTMVVLFSSMSAPLFKLCLRAQGSRLRTTVLRTGRRDVVDATSTASIRSGIRGLLEEMYVHFVQALQS